MIKISQLVVLFGLATCSAASALPMSLGPAKALEQSIVNVRIICGEDGRCYQRGRRPVARWVYGDGNFSGPYTGPGYYGNPRYRWSWWPY
jgi:hypothetical protein